MYIGWAKKFVKDFLRCYRNEAVPQLTLPDDPGDRAEGPGEGSWPLSARPAISTTGAERAGHTGQQGHQGPIPLFCTVLEMRQMWPFPTRGAINTTGEPYVLLEGPVWVSPEGRRRRRGREESSHAGLAAKPSPSEIL